MARRQRRAGAGAQVAHMAGLHDGARQPGLAVEQRDDGRHAGHAPFRVSIEVGDHLDAVALAVLEERGIEDGGAGRGFRHGEAAQPLDGAARGEDGEGLGLQVDGLGHIDEAAHVVLGQDPQLHHSPPLALRNCVAIAPETALQKYRCAWPTPRRPLRAWTGARLSPQH